MGLALLAIIWLITFFSTYFFVAKTWWPHGASTAAAFIDGQFSLTLVLMGIVFVAAQLALGLFVWQFQDRGSASRADYSHGNIRLEVIWTVLTAVLFVGGLPTAGGDPTAICRPSRRASSVISQQH